MMVLRGAAGNFCAMQKYLMTGFAVCSQICQGYVTPEPTPCGHICVMYCVGK